MIEPDHISEPQNESKIETWIEEKIILRQELAYIAEVLRKQAHSVDTSTRKEIEATIKKASNALGGLLFKSQQGLLAKGVRTVLNRGDS